MSKDAFNFSGKAAYNYDTYLGPFLFEPYGKYVATLMDGKRAENILEIAAGTGRLTAHLSEKLNSHARLTATDINADMLAIAEDKLDNDKIKFQIADAESLPFNDDSFDHVFCQFGVMFFKNKINAFKEIYRVLRPGGKFIFSTWDETKKMPVFKIVIDDTLLPFLNETDNSRFLVPFSMYDQQAMLDLLEQAGFKNNSVKNVRLKTKATAREIVTAMVLKHSFRGEIENKDPAGLKPLADKIERELDVLIKEYPDIELSVWIASGLK